MYNSSRYQHLKKEIKGVTRKEEEEMKALLFRIIEIRKGEPEDNKTPFPSEIVSFFVPLIKKIVKDYMMRYSTQSYEELSQEGYTGLLYGLSLFDPEYKNSPTTYVYTWIKNFIQKSIKKKSTMVRETSPYYSVYIYIKNKILNEGFKADEIVNFFPSSKKRDGWLTYPKEIKSTHETLKVKTLNRHIDMVLKDLYQETQYETQSMNKEYEDQYIYSDDNNVEFSVFTDTSYLKKQIYETIDITDEFTNSEKNLYLEYNELSDEKYLILPDIITNTMSYSVFNRQKEKITKISFYANKYNMPINKIKHLITNMNLYLRENITSFKKGERNE